MGPSGHFTRMWTWCGRCKMLGQVVFWVELPVQRRLCPIFMSGVGLPDIQSIPRVDGLSTDPREMGYHRPFPRSLSVVDSMISNV